MDGGTDASDGADCAPAIDATAAHQMWRDDGAAADHETWKRMTVAAHRCGDRAAVDHHHRPEHLLLPRLEDRT